MPAYLFISYLALLIHPAVADLLLLVQLALVRRAARCLGLVGGGRLVVRLLVLLRCTHLSGREGKTAVRYTIRLRQDRQLALSKAMGGGLVCASQIRQLARGEMNWA